MKFKNNIIGKNIKLGEGSAIGAFCIIGYKPLNKNVQKKTLIGKNANIRSHTVIYEGNLIGNNFQTGHGALVREDNIIGNNVSIGSHSVIEHHVKIGDNVRIHSNSFIPEYTILEDNVWIGPQVTFTNTKYPAAPLAKKYLKGVRIKKKARIGAGAIILPGVVIGENVLVGAGAVVTSDIPANKVVINNPARIIGEVDNLLIDKNIKAYS